MKRLDNVSLRQVTNQIETLLSQGFIIDQKRVHLEQNVIQECHMLLEAIHSNASLKQSPGLFQDKSTIYKNITDNIYTIKNLKLKPHFQSGVLPKDLEKRLSCFLVRILDKK